MTLSEIRQIIRVKLDDEVGTDSQKYFKDATLNEFINESIEEMCERTLCIIDSLTDAVCLIPLVAGQRHYALHESILDIEAVSPSWRNAALEKQFVATVGSGWKSSIGLPTSFLLDYTSGMLTITSAPQTVTTESLRLTARRLPVTELKSNADKTELPKTYQRKLYQGILAKAFSCQDSEIYNPKKAAFHADKWEQILSDSVRRDARLRPRFTIARRVEMC